MIRLSLPLIAVVAFAACAPAARTARPGQPAPIQITGAASTAEVDSLWARADGLFRQAKWADAATLLERLNLEYASGDPRIARTRFELAECYFGSSSHLQAAREFRRVSDDLPSDELAPEALLRAGDVYADLWQRPELDPTYAQTALQTYHELQSRYPGTSAARRAVGRIAGLEDLLAFKQYKAGLFYLKYKAYDSAIIYFKDLATGYPKASSTPLALLRLIEIYRILGYQEDLTETCGYARKVFPGTAGLTEACTAPVVAPPTPAPPPAAHG
ncbi:MAG: outer membrane protein assembly factor BamD [Gemmatimonadales bacterium]